MSMKPLRGASAAAILLAAAGAVASEIVPPSPLPFERVNLRMNVDSCVFDPSTVFVTTTDQGIEVRLRNRACLLPGEPRVVDIQLGAYPAGSYRVRVTNLSGDFVSELEALRFQVVPPAEILIYPPPPRPITDYTGLWWSPQESGWGLSIHQGPLHTLFGALFIYDAGGSPTWYTIQPGGWSSSTRWSGIVYRTTGPYFAGPDYDPRVVLVQAAGNAVLEFEQAPGTVGQARFTYTVQGVTTTKTIQRLRL
jgi:hypothetical protein